MLTTLQALVARRYTYVGRHRIPVQPASALVGPPTPTTPRPAASGGSLRESRAAREESTGAPGATLPAVRLARFAEGPPDAT